MLKNVRCFHTEHEITAYALFATLIKKKHKSSTLPVSPKYDDFLSRTHLPMYHSPIRLVQSSASPEQCDGSECPRCVIILY